jgi:pteridine reductase
VFWLLGYVRQHGLKPILHTMDTMADAVNNLAGRTALVTGAGKRLGRAISLGLAARGVNVVIHYNRSGGEASSLLEEVQALDARGWLVAADLEDPGQLDTLFDRAASQAGPIDILVNNASIWPQQTLWDVTDQSLTQAMRVHALAPLVMARALARQRRPGHVINMLDTRVTSYDRDHAAYHVSKRSLLTLTRMLALELAPDVAVNAVAPGLLLPPEGQDESYLERLAHTNPLHRHGGPQDIVDAVLFLLTSRFVTGQVLYVDGGYHMKGHLYD